MPVKRKPTADDGNTIAALVFAGNLHIFHHATLAMKHFGIATASSMLVIKGKKPHSRNRIGQLARQQGWKDVIELDYQDAERVFARPVLARCPSLLRRLGLYSAVSQLIVLRAQVKKLERSLDSIQSAAVIIGGIYASPLERTVSSLVPHEQFILVDDGHMTRITAASRAAESVRGYKKVLDTNNHKGRDGLRRRLRNMLFRRVCKVRDLGEQRLVFYTAHDLELQPPDQLVKMQYLAANSVVEVGATHILGMAVISRKIIPAETYGAILKNIAARAAGKKLVYFPHPAERPVDLELVRRYLPGIRIESYDRGYEAGLLARGTHPESIYVCYSSAIRNVASMGLSGMTINVMRIPGESFIDSNRRDRVDEVYRTLEGLPQVQFIDP